MDRIWEWQFQAELFFRRMACWFLRHDEIAGNVYDYEADYCGRCLVEWPQDKTTLPDLLNRLYCWGVNRDWEWFLRLDQWLIEKHGRFLPSWWEY